MLDSLLATDYMGDEVPMEMYIDAPADDQGQDEALLSEHAKVIELCNAFEWPHGPKKVIVREQVRLSPERWPRGARDGWREASGWDTVH